MLRRTLLLLITLSAPLSLRADEIARRRQAFDRLATAMAKTIADPRADARYLLRDHDKLLGHVSWLRDKNQRPWADDARADLSKLKDVLKRFVTFHDRHRAMPRTFDDYRTQTQARAAKDLAQLEALLKALKRDLRQLDRSEREAKVVWGRMRDLGREVARTLARHPQLEAHKVDADKLKSYYGKTATARGFRDALRRGVEQRMRAAQDALKALAYKLKPLTRGERWEPFDKVWRRFEAAAKLLREHAQTVITWSRKLAEQRKAADDRLRAVADRIEGGRITDAMAMDLALYKSLGRVFTEARRTPVFEALETAWLPVYAAQLKSLYTALQGLEAIRVLIVEMDKTLERLPAQAARDLKAAYEGPIAKADAAALGVAADALATRYAALDGELRRGAKEIATRWSRIRFERRERAFERVRERLRRRYEDWLKSTRARWKSAYAKADVRWARAGRAAREGPFKRGAERIFAGKGRAYQEQLTRWARPWRDGKLPSRDALKTLDADLDAFARWVKTNRTAEPRWLAGLGQDMDELIKCLPLLAEYQKANARTVAEYERFRAWCDATQIAIRADSAKADSLAAFSAVRVRIQRARETARGQWLKLRAEAVKGLGVARKALVDRSSTELTRAVYAQRRRWLEGERARLIALLKALASDPEVLEVLRGLGS